MMAFPIVFISIFGGIFGAIALMAARVIALLTGRSTDEILEKWENAF